MGTSMSLTEQSKKGEHGELLAILEEQNGNVVSYFKKAKISTDFNELIVRPYSSSVKSIQSIIIYELKEYDDNLLWVNENELDKSEIFSETV